MDIYGACILRSSCYSTSCWLPGSELYRGSWNIQDFFKVFLSTPPPFQMDRKGWNVHLTYLPKTWITKIPLGTRFHPALASINCSTESVIPWSFWAWNPLNHGRRILFDNTSREHSQQDAENDVKKRYSSSNPSGNLSNCSPNVEKTSKKGTICFFGGGGN